MTDLIAPQLIDLLLEHPVVCGMLGLTFGLGCAGTPMVTGVCVSLLENDHEPWTTSFGYWLTGAAVEKCDELGIEIVRYADGFGTIERQHVVATTGDIGHRMVIGKKHPTRLHAALAALEQHAKENSNG